MEINQADVLLRKKGEEVTTEDLKMLLSAPPRAIRAKFSQLGDLALFVRADQIERSVKNNDLKSKAVKQSAAGMLTSIGQNPIESKTDTLHRVEEKVENIIKAMKDTPSVKTYFWLIDSARRSGDALELHDKAVSAIAVLILLTLGAKEPDELSDIATAGLLHDIGLESGPRQVMMAHCEGKTEFKADQKIAFRRHIDASLDIIVKNKIKVSPNVTLAIQQHHENWDGSGFRGMVGNKISRDARILRIADELACRLAESPPEDKLFDVLKSVAHLKSLSNLAIFDPDIMLTLIETAKHENTRMVVESPSSA